jgi:hypothetical protein
MGERFAPLCGVLDDRLRMARGGAGLGPWFVYAGSFDACELRDPAADVVAVGSNCLPWRTGLKIR